MITGSLKVVWASANLNIDQTCLPVKYFESFLILEKGGAHTNRRFEVITTGLSIEI